MRTPLAQSGARELFVSPPETADRVHERKPRRTIRHSRQPASPRWLVWKRMHRTLPVAYPASSVERIAV